MLRSFWVRYSEDWADTGEGGEASVLFSLCNIKPKPKTKKMLD